MVDGRDRDGTRTRYPGRFFRRKSRRRGATHPAMEKLVSEVLLGPEESYRLSLPERPGTDFDGGLAAFMAKASQLSYSVAQDYHALGDKLTELTGVSLVRGEFVPVLGITEFVDTRAFIGATEQFIVVSFCGTQPLDLKDWLTDFGFDPLERELPFCPGRVVSVHTGFNQALELVWESVCSTVLKFRSKKETPSRPVYFTGHSLGGALAMLASTWVPAKYIDWVGGVYAFGAPVVGDHRLHEVHRELMGWRTWRYVNDRDIVPKVIPEGYVRMGDLRSINISSRELRELKWRKPSVALVEKVARLLLPEGIDDHYPECYLQGALQDMEGNRTGEVPWTARVVAAALQLWLRIH